GVLLSAARFAVRSRGRRAGCPRTDLARPRIVRPRAWVTGDLVLPHRAQRVRRPPPRDAPAAAAERPERPGHRGRRAAGAVAGRAVAAARADRMERRVG